MKVALIVLTDGRLAYLERALASCKEMIGFDLFEQLVIINDASNQPYYGGALDLLYTDEGFDIYPPMREKRGFSGTIRSAWSVLRPEIDFVFHLEDDFEIRRPVPIEAMADALDVHPYIQQFALRRQPWNDQEKAAGGIVEMWPAAYRDVTWNGHQWLEHDLFFTTNPSLYRAKLTQLGWPAGAGSELQFTRTLQAHNAENCFAYWGPRTDDPWVTHIGEERIGTGY